MSLNKLKKMIVFSSDRIKKIVENLIQDEAIIENRSASALIEKHLLDDLLPINKDARAWLGSLYADEWGIGDVLHAAFDVNAAGTRGPWSSKWDNLLPLVQFAKRQESNCFTVPSGEEPELHHFRSQLDTICTKLEDLSKDENIESSYAYLSSAKYARELLRIAEEEPHFMRYVNYYELIIDNWDALKNWSITYRMLCDLTHMEKGWNTTPETRNELTNILKDLSKEWVE